MIYYCRETHTKKASGSDKSHLWWDTDGVADNIGPPNHQVRVGRNPNYAANESDGEPLLAWKISQALKAGTKKLNKTLEINV